MSKRKLQLHLVDRNIKHSKELFGYDTSSFLEPTYIEWIRDQIPQDNEVTFFTDEEIFSQKVDEVQGLKFAWLLEPYEINPSIYNNIRNVAHKFEGVLTYHYETLADLKNAIPTPCGGCWIKKIDWDIHTKTKSISMIASNKKLTSGHLLRHEIFANKKNEALIDFYGTITDEHLAYKFNALKDYRFSIVIENDRSPNFFTEKLIDCFISGTIPVYWGCSNIADFFDARSIIIATRLDDFENENLGSLSEELYESMLPSIQRNFELAKQYVLGEDWIFRNVLQKFREE